jgi:hypothetical protein
MDAKRKSERPSSGRGTRVVVAIIIAVVILFTAVSVGSYVFGLNTPTTNYGGILGSYLARALYFALGKASLVIPVLLGAAALISIGRKRNWRGFASVCVLNAGLFTAGSLLDFHALAVSAETNFGGWTGLFLGRELSRLFGISAYALPALAVYWGFVMWFRAPLVRDLVQSTFIVLIGLFLELFVAYFGGPVYLSGPPGSRSGFPAAGTAGLGLCSGLKALLGPVGSLIALLAGVLIMIAVFTTVRLPEFGWLRAIVAALVNRARRATGKPPPPEPPRVEPGLPSVPPELRPGPSLSPETKPTLEPGNRPGEQRPAERPRRLPAAPRFDLSEFQTEFLAQLDRPGEKDRVSKDRRESEQEANLLLDKLRQFGIDGRISDILSGPMVTRFELEPAPGVKIMSIASRADDISLALAAERVRILAPIPGKNAVGIEIPNKDRRTVYLREVLTSEPFREERSPLGFALGTTITGEPTSADLRVMPHVLIAGTTGSGKSVCINSMIASIIYRSSPQDVRFLTIDPKQLELPVYNPIPHLLGMTTTDPDRAVKGLARIVDIMEARYGEFANIGVRDIVGYNARARQEGFAAKPYIVVVIDELADLMLRAPNEIEERITRLAQMSRAVGIHLVLATQRPSVDVITGLIKANFPCRIAFQVASKTDSRTILDMNGAESLLGRGDMLFLPPGKGEPVRLHGSFVSDRAAKRIVDLWARTYLAELLTGVVENPAEKARQIVERDVVDVLYDKERSGIKRKLEDLRTILPEEAVDNLMSRRYYDLLPEESPETLAERQRTQEEDRELDDKFTEAAQIVVRHREASVSMLQRRLDIGWARAGRIIDQLEQAGIVGPYVGSKSRKVLVDSEMNLQKLLSELRGEQQ